MKNKQQPFFTWYFILAFLAFLLVQTYVINAPHVETIAYSQFKALVKENAVSGLVIAEKTIKGNIKGEALKEVLLEEKLKALKHDGKTAHPFMTVRVEEPELTAELEAAA